MEQLIIDHRLFQRLRHISQLALTYHAYPGATHSRFEHSLGVMELATRAFDTLAVRHGELLTENFGALPELRMAPMPMARQLVRLMALLHDVGHTPFSHACDGLLAPKNHEELSAWVVSPQGPLGKILDRAFFPGISELHALMLAEDRHVPPQLLILKRLVSGQLDIDRMDYLLRDSLHCGVGYGSFDHERLLGSLTVHYAPETESLALGVEPGGLHTFEALLLARYFMTTQVYFHRVRRAYDLLLEKWIRAWGVEHFNPLPRVLEYDDISLLHQIQIDARAGRGERRRWAKRIIERRHPRMVWESNDHAGPPDLLFARKLAHRLGEDFPAAEFYVDERARGTIHKLRVPEDQTPIETVYVVLPGAKLEHVGWRSQIIAKIPKEFWVIRVFGYFKNDRDRQRAQQSVREVEEAN